MIKIIENALRDLAGMQLNLESDVARTWIAQRIEKAITEHQQIEKDLTQIVPELNVDDVIVSAMENNGYTKGDSGYDFRSGKRDITFHAPNNDQYEVVFRKINNE